MMISPETYVLLHENESFDQLIKERESLIQEIADLEKIVFDDNKLSDAWQIKPGPDVQYQLTLEYLAELCKFMSQKYNREVVWGEDEDEDEEIPDSSIEIKKIGINQSEQVPFYTPLKGTKKANICQSLNFSKEEYIF